MNTKTRFRSFFPTPMACAISSTKGLPFAFRNICAIFWPSPSTPCDDLKALASISKVITQLNVDIADPDKRRKTLDDIASIFGGMKKQRTSAAAGS